ncbi:hypothetical protein LCGC14_0355110 [marine sediment metagenome]|uniref:Uncharacterized protein n=1 Tax=marine sediment metagenome TaxID=412755 RepID=A0A0F9VWW1_9ZZZZ
MEYTDVDATAVTHSFVTNAITTLLYPGFLKMKIRSGFSSEIGGELLYQLRKGMNISPFSSITEIRGSIASVLALYASHETLQAGSSGGGLALGTGLAHAANAIRAATKKGQCTSSDYPLSRGARLSLWCACTRIA